MKTDLRLTKRRSRLCFWWTELRALPGRRHARHGGSPDLTKFNKSEGRTASVAKNGIKGEKRRFCQKLMDADVQLWIRSSARWMGGRLQCGSL